MSEFSDFCCRIYDRENNYNANLAKPPLSSAIFLADREYILDANCLSKICKILKLYLTNVQCPKY